MDDNVDNNKDNEARKLFNINGKDLNIKIYIDKNIDENIINTISINDLFANKQEKDFICFTLSNLNIKNEENIPILYDVLSLNYCTPDNKSYPLLKLIEHKNSPQYKESSIINKPNDITVDLQFQILLFINTKIIKNILDYINFVSGKKEKSTSIGDDDMDNAPYVGNNNICDGQEKACKKTCNMCLKIKEVKIYLMNEEETLLKIDDLLTDLPDNIIKNNKNYNYVCIDLNEFSTKLECNKDNMKMNLSLKSFIIKDNIEKSKYKILLSNYNFKKTDEVFIKCDFDIYVKKDINQLEINPTISICPISIYLDQMTLYYLFNIYNGIKSKKEDENEKQPHDINNNDKNKDVNIIDKKTKMKNNDIMINNTFINNFFLQLNYNTNSEVNDIEFSQKNIVLLLNNISLTNLQINFKEYKKENCGFYLHEALKDIYEFYYNDIVNPNGMAPIISALPLINHFFSIVAGTLDIVREPMQNYKNNESVTDGFVKGVTSCVVNAGTIFTYFGEKISNYFNFLGCNPRYEGDELNDNFCRQFRHKINENNKEIEEYYFK
jgi:hypothetical protein